jgi:hypothetical protein
MKPSHRPHENWSTASKETQGQASRELSNNPKMMSEKYRKVEITKEITRITRNLSGSGDQSHQTALSREGQGGTGRAGRSGRSGRSGRWISLIIWILVSAK